MGGKVNVLEQPDLAKEVKVVMPVKVVQVVAVVHVMEWVEVVAGYLEPVFFFGKSVLAFIL